MKRTSTASDTGSDTDSVGEPSLVLSHSTIVHTDTSEEASEMWKETQWLSYHIIRDHHSPGSPLEVNNVKAKLIKGLDWELIRGQRVIGTRPKSCKALHEFVKTIPVLTGGALHDACSNGPYRREDEDCFDGLWQTNFVRSQMQFTSAPPFKLLDNLTSSLSKS